MKTTYFALGPVGFSPLDFFKFFSLASMRNFSTHAWKLQKSVSSVYTICRVTLFFVKVCNLGDLFSESDCLIVLAMLKKETSIGLQRPIGKG